MTEVTLVPDGGPSPEKAVSSLSPFAATNVLVPTTKGQGIWHANQAVRQAERELAHQAEIAYAPPCATTTPPRPPRRARARHRDAHLQAVKAASSAAGPQSQTLRF